MIEVNGRFFDYLTYESRNGQLVVHGWSTYPDHSVLAGQAMKCYLDSFEGHELEELQEAYPTAEPSHPMLQPKNTFDHLPDGPDY